MEKLQLQLSTSKNVQPQHQLQMAQIGVGIGVFVIWELELEFSSNARIHHHKPASTLPNSSERRGSVFFERINAEMWGENEIDQTNVMLSRAETASTRSGALEKEKIWKKLKENTFYLRRLSPCRTKHVSKHLPVLRRTLRHVSTLHENNYAQMIG